MRQVGVDFYSSKRLSLEGIYTTPHGVREPFPAMLVCHPHPMLGGDMDNAVVTSICRAAADEGIASLRFNFRGAGDSEGAFDDGNGERDDVKHALEFLGLLPGADRSKLAVVGYSFGAAVLLRALPRLKSAQSLVLIAPPVGSVVTSKIKKDKRDKLFLVGQHDGVGPSAGLQRALDDVRQPVQFVEIPEADHSLLGHEQLVAEAVVEFVLRTVNPAPAEV